MKLLMRSWANFDPEGALTYASKSLDAKSERRFGISEALAGWAVKDQKAAIAWAEANHPGNENSDNPLLVGIVKGLIEHDLDAANRLFLNLPKGSARWQSSSLLAEKYAEQGVQQGMQWAESYPEDDPRMRETILRSNGGQACPSRPRGNSKLGKANGGRTWCLSCSGKFNSSMGQPRSAFRLIVGQ